MRIRRMMAIMALSLAVAGFGVLHLRDAAPQMTPIAETELTWHWTNPPQRLGDLGPFQPLIDHLAH